MKKILLCLIALLYLTVPGHAQVSKDISPAYAKAFAQYLEASGSEQAYATAITQMINLYRGQRSEVPTVVWDKLEERMQTAMPELITQLAPVYASHLTLEDLNELIAFYQSPIGRKLVAATPEMMRESMQIGSRWGAKLGEQIGRELEGLLKEQQNPGSDV